jgi:Arc/MetJ-type ribon-helix-helix transcriptional regulator
MSYAFPPELDRLVQETMATGGYEDQDELLISAIRTLNESKQRHDELRCEIKQRLARTGRGFAIPLDLDSFKAEARNRAANGS